MDWREALANSPPTPDRFVRQVRYRDAGMRFTVRVNDEYVVVDVDGAFGLGISCSFGERRVISGRARRDRGLSAWFGLVVFLEPCPLSVGAADLLRRQDVQQSVWDLHLGTRESLHFCTGQASLYLRRYDCEELLSAISILTGLLVRLPRLETESLSLESLPPEFHQLIPLMKRWAVSDDVERHELLARASPQRVKDLVRTVTPYFGAINRYLDSFGDTPLPEHACMLGALAECATEARQK
jgi:hypothetical protein